MAFAVKTLGQTSVYLTETQEFVDKSNIYWYPQQKLYVLLGASFLLPELSEAPVLLPSTAKMLHSVITWVLHFYSFSQ